MRIDRKILANKKEKSIFEIRFARRYSAYVFASGCSFFGHTVTVSAHLRRTIDLKRSTS